MRFQDTLNQASGRFKVITLEDRNLPQIARDRLLRPREDRPEAKALLDAAFTATTKVRRDVWDTLLGEDSRTGGDSDAFRVSYPFSPAFMATLVEVSSALQRTRSGMKLMREILVDHRDELRLGDLIPLGDLYEVLSKPGDTPFTDKLKAEFELAQKLYQGKLRPSLLEQFQVTEDDVVAVRAGSADAATVAKVKAFTGDDRLIKTLLLAALAPTVSALKNLTARKLAALNHGSIRTPIAGDVGTVVARKITDWASRFNEITKTDADDPAVSLQLVGIDVDSIISAARDFAKHGAKVRMVQRMLWRELGLTLTGQLRETAKVTWRGSERVVELFFGTSETLTICRMRSSPLTIRSAGGSFSTTHSTMALMARLMIGNGYQTWQEDSDRRAPYVGFPPHSRLRP